MAFCLCPCFLARAAAPVAPVRNVTDHHFGVAVDDPYRYMEDLNDPETQQWIKSQAEYAAQTGRPRCGIRFVRPEEVYGPSYEDIRRRVPDVARMRRILRVAPRVDLATGLRRTIAWFLENGAAGPR